MNEPAGCCIRVMRILRDRQASCICSAPPATQPSLNSSLGKLWDEWAIQCLILVSLGLQVFLFLASGLRRRCGSRILRSLLWLAYLSADSVAIFVLGHLAVHANEPRHQLLFFWAPFVLLHLGGQDTMTAFSMQDNELWRRHLLGLVTQVAMAGYAVTRISWPDRRLLAAMVLIFLSGCLRYAERTLCLYNASPTSFRESSLASLTKSSEKVNRIDSDGNGSVWRNRLSDMLNERNLAQTFGQASSTAIALVADTPINDTASIEASQRSVRGDLKELKSNKDRCRVYNYVSTRLVLVYECLYTKVPFRFFFIEGLESIKVLCSMCTTGCCACMQCYCCCCCCCPLFFCLYFVVSALLLLFPFLSTTTTLVLFKFVRKGELYSRADVLVSYTLLIGAIILEVASLVVSIISYVSKFRSARKQWSEMLGQYNMIESLTGQEATGMMPHVPEWIGKHLYDKTSHVPISHDLKKFVLDKMLDFGTREQDWNFASFRGQLALRNWINSHQDSVFAMSAGPSLQKSINDVDFPTSVLIWHIATDILYIQEHTSINRHDQKMKKILLKQKKMKKMTRELSNYIMYLVFKCGVMLTSSTELLHNKAHMEMEKILGRHVNLSEEEAIRIVFEANKEAQRSSASGSQLTATEQPLESKLITLISLLLPHARDLARDLINIHTAQGDCWNLIATVWVEMLYNIAPRCGGAFHSEHLSTGGEFITHVLVLMQLLGPFIPS